MILYRRTGETGKRGNGERKMEKRRDGEKGNEILEGWRGYPASGNLR